MNIELAMTIDDYVLQQQLERDICLLYHQLSAEEKAEVVANCDHLRKLKFSPQLPYAFTGHGAIMAATILNSPRAVDVSDRLPSA